MIIRRVEILFSANFYYTVFKFDLIQYALTKPEFSIEQLLNTVA